MSKCPHGSTYTLEEDCETYVIVYTHCSTCHKLINTNTRYK